MMTKPRITDRTWVEINLDNYQHNISELKRFIPENTSFLQIVKADAYGHSAWNIALEAKKAGAVMLGVANVDEASLLDYQGIGLPILILSPITVSELDVVLEHDFIPAISDLNIALELNQKAASKNKMCKIHLNVDTGMNRSGVRWDQFREFYNSLKLLSNLEINGVFSHFAGSENDAEFTELQSNRFKKVIEDLPRKPEFIHIANSSAILNGLYPFCNLVRLGILSFGIYTSDEQRNVINLKPVLCFKTAITQLKTAYKGESIGYNRTYSIEKETRFAVLPLGYADGYDFLLSNKGVVEINNHHAPVIGKVSMDMITIDVTAIPEAGVGTEVILLGGISETRVEAVTKAYNGLSYELLCQVGRRAKRYFRSKGEIIDSAPLLRRGFYSHDFSNKSLNNIIESALRERLQGSEISEMLYRDILKDMFFRHDNDFGLRKDFHHTIEFRDCVEFPDFYSITTTLTYRKILRRPGFLVVCTQQEEQLQAYFLRSDVAYRWFLGNEIPLDKSAFVVNSATVNQIELTPTTTIKDNVLEINCFSDNLLEMMDKEVEFSISTTTYYPKKNRQFSVYIAELTKGIDIGFKFKGQCANVEVVTVFSGQERYPNIKRDDDSIEVSTGIEDWIFPTSGIVFVYN
ncbi:MAG: alanine racemase [Candidatus Cloacimonetes bacterium]|nr:alanine racemase [Candidatus Cloacimonadota bacterium]